MLIIVLMKMPSQQCLDDVGSGFDGVMMAYNEIGMSLEFDEACK